MRQGEPLGLGHAVLVTRSLVGDEPFAVILGDDVIDANPPALRQMIDVFHEVDGPVLAIEEVPRENVSSYGIIDAEEVRPGVYRIRDMVEKPPRDEAPSNLAIIGRYVLTPDIFPALEETATEKDRTGEIQLTNGLRRLLKKRPIYGCKIDGVRHDTGNKLGFLKAVVYFALRRPGPGGAVQRIPARASDSTCPPRPRGRRLSPSSSRYRVGLGLRCRLGLGRLRSRSIFVSDDFESFEPSPFGARLAAGLRQDFFA